MCAPPLSSSSWGVEIFPFPCPRGVRFICEGVHSPCSMEQLGQTLTEFYSPTTSNERKQQLEQGLHAFQSQPSAVATVMEIVVSIVSVEHEREIPHNSSLPSVVLSRRLGSRPPVLPYHVLSAFRVFQTQRFLRSFAVSLLLSVFVRMLRQGVLSSMDTSVRVNGTLYPSKIVQRTPAVPISETLYIVTPTCAFARIRSSSTEVLYTPISIRSKFHVKNPGGRPASMRGRGIRASENSNMFQGSTSSSGPPPRFA